MPSLDDFIKTLYSPYLGESRECGRSLKVFVCLLFTVLKILLLASSVGNREERFFFPSTISKKELKIKKKKMRIWLIGKNAFSFLPFNIVKVRSH